MPADSGAHEPEMDADAAASVFDFVQHYLDDEACGQARELEHYLALYPGHDEAITREFRLLKQAQGQPAPPVEHIAHYRLMRELGRGGQGSVWLAQDEALHRPVALKLLNSWLIRGERMARFRREAESIAKLEHEGLATVFEANMEGAQPYIAMRFIEGEDLGSCLHRTGSARAFCRPQSAGDVRQTLLFFERAARALHAAHEAGVVHRDIKPSNILVTAEDRPVITDFGLAQDEFTPHEETITREGEVFGTPAYMSPEQIEGRRGTIDRRTDVWSLGATLFEALTGKPPFEGRGHMGLAKAILEDPLPNPRLGEGGKHIPQDLVVVLQSALERDPARRYPTALAFAEDLRRIREFEPILARRASPGLRLKRWCRREPAWATALGLLIVGLVGGLIASQVMLGRIQAALNQERSLRFVRQVPALLENKPSDALAVGLEAVRLHDSWISRSSLFGPLEALTLYARPAIPTQLRAWDAGYFDEGRRAFACGEQGLALYSTRDGELLGECSFGTGGTATVRECIPLPNDNAFVVGTEAGQVRRLNGLELETAWERDLGSQVQSMALHPDGKRVLVLTLDSGAFLIDVGTGETRSILPVPPRTASLALFSPQGERVLMASRANRGKPEVSVLVATLWDTETGTPLAELRHRGSVRSACFDPEGRTLATGTLAGEVRLWDAHSGAALATQPEDLEGGVECLDIARDGSTLVAGDGRGAWLCSLDTKVWTELQGPPSKVSSIAFRPDGTLVAGSGWDNVIRVWDSASGRVVREHRADKRIWSLAWSPDGMRLLSAGVARYLYLWNLFPDPAAFRFHGGGDAMVWAQFLPGGERAIVAEANGRVTLIETPRKKGAALPGQPVRTLAEHGSGPLCAIARAAPRAVTGGADGRVLVHDLVGGQVVAARSGHAMGIRDLAIAPDGQTVVIVDGLGLVVLWHPGQDGGARPMGIQQQVQRVVFAPDGSAWAAGDALGSILVWKPESASPVFVGVPSWGAGDLDRHPVLDLGFSPDGKTLYAATDPWYLHAWKWQADKDQEQRERRMWHRWLRVLPSGGAITVGTGRGSFDAGQGELGKRPDTLHTQDITAIDLDPSGQWIATGSEDNQVLIWNWISGQTQCRFDLHQGPIRSVCFSPEPDDDRVLSASDDGTVALWHRNPVPAAQALAPHGLGRNDLARLNAWGSKEVGN
ncbi:MAG TPA: serine/threonine-protein kinase [Planctomycetota bacterium]|nr:serine/threonine-protein kinase [Planctomycetota bacterium]